MGDPFELRTESRVAGNHEVTALIASGEIDLSNADTLRTALGSQNDSRGLVLDLSEVAFMDSSGLSVVLTAAEELGSRLVLVIPEGSRVARLLELTEASGWVNSAPTEEEALSLLGSPDGA